MDEADLDSLLDMEEHLMDGDGGDAGLKRSRADLQSQADAAAFAAAAGGTAAPDSSSKRPRVGAASEQPSSRFPAPTEEQALLALAADSQVPSQSLGGVTASFAAWPAARPAPSHSHLAATEEQALLAMVAGSQPSQSVLPGAIGAGGASGWATGGSAAAPRPAGRPQAAAPDDIDELDALLAEEMNLLEDDEERAPRQPGGGAHGAPPAAAEQQQQQQVQQQQQQQAAQGAAEQQQGARGPSVECLLPQREYVPPAKAVTSIRGPSLTVTSQSGERVYCAMAAPAPAARRLDLAAALRRSRGSLLSEPIEALLAAVEQDQYQRALAETAAETAAAAAGGRAASASPGARHAGGGRRASAAGAGAAGGRRRSSLWVDKYAPRSYLDLLSDEQTNREVVRWLKGWDPCVFGTTAPQALAQQARGFGSRAGGSRYQRFGGGGGGGGEGDPLGRPEHKVILIAGPPGLGKTTLAHVCAAHCGYRPVEINASDDRGGAALQARVLDAVEMQSVMGERRPNCVIIDEIDGATGGAEGRSGIAALLKIVTAVPGGASKAKQGGGGGRGGDAEPDSDSDGEEGPAGVAAARRGTGASAAATGRGGGGAAGAKRAPARVRPLLRPIICICNDLYAPALRPLRDVALVFQFKKPQAERLAQRLQAVCAAEGLAAEKSTLRLLVERTDCDVRSCLNTLQFLARKQRVVRQADLASLRVGQKDMTKGAFAVWTELLQKKKAPGIIGRAAETEAGRGARLYHMLQDFGEADLVLGGVHENVLGLRYFDMALQRTSAVLNSLGDADRLLRGCHRGGDFGLLKFLPAPLVAISGLVAGPDRPQLQWPRAGYDAARRLAANQALLHGWQLGLAPAAAAATGRSAMVLEVLPALMLVAAPALRPVSQHLYSSAEQQVVRGLVDTLLHYNLRYCLEPSPEELEEERQREAEAAAADAAAEGGEGGGAMNHLQQQRMRDAPAEPPLRFRPPVHRACAFPGMEPKGRALPAAVRQTVSHEADMEAIRRAEVARRGPGTGASPLGASNRGGAPGAPAATGPSQAAAGRVVPLTLAERMKASGTAAGAAARAARAAAAPRGTWLDALKEQHMARAAAANGGQGGGRSNTFPVLYKFHEGYTNAVKRPVLMRELL